MSEHEFCAYGWLGRLVDRNCKVCGKRRAEHYRTVEVEPAEDDDTSSSYRVDLLWQLGE